MNAATSWTGACAVGETLSIPAKHTTGRYWAPDRCWTSWRPTARSCCATPRARTSTAPRATSRASRNEGRQRRRADAAPRARGRRADGLRGRAEAVRVAPPRVPAHEHASRARAHRLRVRPDRREDGARAERGRAGRVLADVVRALRLQALAAAARRRCRPRARGWSWARARTRARCPSATAWPARSRSSRTTTRARSSPSRAPRPASAASCATSSPSAPGRSRSSTRCASASSASARSRYLLEHAVAGIGHYGNSIGIATVGGEIYFEGPYEQNCLVNAMALGLIETDKLIRSAAAGVGNIVVLFGARTGRDGIGGASVLASAELDDDRGQAPDGADRRPVRGEEAARVLARAARPRAARRAAGPRRGGPDVLVGRDGRQGRGRARPRRPQACRCARPDMEPFEIMV